MKYLQEEDVVTVNWIYYEVRFPALAQMPEDSLNANDHLIAVVEQ